MVGYLLEMGAEVNQRGQFESTCIHAAVAAGRNELLDMLVDAGGDVNAHNQVLEETFKSTGRASTSGFCALLYQLYTAYYQQCRVNTLSAE